MAEEPSNNLDERESAEESSSAAFGVETPHRTGEGRTRRGRSVASLEVEEGPFAGMSVDTFAVPSEQPLERNEDPKRKLTGPEPAIFGGATPEDPTAAVVDPEAGPRTEEQTNAEQIGGALDEAVQTGDLLDNVPKVDYLRIIRSTPFLLGAMVFMLVASTVLVRLIVETQTYVQTSVHFQNYTLNAKEQADLLLQIKQEQADLQHEIERVQADLQLEIKTLLRTLPVRKQAWDILQKRAPELKPGFLDTSLTFFRMDSITWLPEGVVQIRVDSNDPPNDLIRLQAFNDAFYQAMEDRRKKKDEYQDTLKRLEQEQVQLAQDDAALKKQIEDLSPEAQRYADLKQSMQSMERYVEVADESNPLRLVARQNLARLTNQVADTRQLSLQRDDLMARRVTLQRKTADTAEAIKQMQLKIRLFPWPDPSDPKALRVHDTRPVRTTVMRAAWISIIVFFGATIFLIHLHDQRAAEAARRERRAKLKAQQKRELLQNQP